MLSILQIFEILLILLTCKSAVNWLPEGPAAGAEPSESAPTPQGVKGVPIPLMQFLRFSGSWGSGGVPPPSAGPSHFYLQIWSKIESKKSSKFWPKMTSHRDPQNLKISPNLQNGTLKHLSRALLAAFIPGKVSKSSPRTSRTSKISVLP